MPAATPFGPAELPSGVKVFFKEPTNSDRRQLAEGLYGSDLLKTPGKMDEALAYSCLVKLDERDLEQEGIPWTKRSDLLTLKDGQFYQLLFSDMFGLNKQDVDAAEAMAKKLRGSI